MNAADALLLALIAATDLALVVYLRKRRTFQKRSKRMMASLALAVRREPPAMSGKARRSQLLRVS
jgi:hypothetical protein